MNKSCARCTKVVYPLEELKCLDKIWHKTCFKCHECGMVLNMKTYKGFNKLPYCEAHIPKAKATAIADTPELKRIAENTKIQSNIKYHAEFEKQKGKVTQVADDPETLRIKQNTKIISNIAYHGDLEKKAAMEKQRGTAEILDGKGVDPDFEFFSEAFAADPLLQYQPTQHQHICATSNTNNFHETNTHYQESLSAPTLPLNFQHQQHDHIQPQTSFENNAKSSSGLDYHQINIQQRNEQQPQMQSYQTRRPTVQQSNVPTPTSQLFQDTIYQQPNPLVNSYMQMRTSIVQNAHLPSGGRNADTSLKYYDQYENYHRPKISSQKHIHINHCSDSNNTFNKVQQSNIYESDYNALTTPQMNGGVSSGSILSGFGTTAGISSIGKIADYDPLTDGPRNIPSTPRQSATLIYSSDLGAANTSNPRKIGSITDIDPANGIYSSIVEGNNKQDQFYQDQNPEGPPRIPQITLQQQSKLNPPAMNRRVYRALYDYEAQDSDEVSFAEGDLIFEIESIDSGWMTGKVERTGKTGMLPANYIQPVLI